ncbi:hypothetical protein [Methanosphaera sp. WGK6]|uniref:hypothetical protein n=1 Tax=Methanosphaera sp. WGK6 TaxID=1561964 RepID=UPI00084C6451|nr:hypothetical protein [Methanosphaera sp. WGK6]OED30180.1 hypothetical protein NL43_04600 [Methanosphaera sp. WGK6]
MNRKIIFSCLILIILVIIGLFYISNNYKASSDIPSINSNLQKGNEHYNTIVNSINEQKYSEAKKESDTTLEYYSKAKNNTQKALNKAMKQNNSIQIKYLNYTLDEINMKINATYEIRSGINLINPDNLSISENHFQTSNQLMQNATQYTDKRNQLEKQYPDKFID